VAQAQVEIAQKMREFHLNRYYQHDALLKNA